MFSPAASRSRHTRDEINDLAERFRVPVQPIADTLVHPNRISFLTYPISDPDKPTRVRTLHYGVRYRVIKPIKPNRAGDLTPGQIILFRGCYVFSYDNGLRLHFEHEDGSDCILEFEGNIPQLDGITMWSAALTKSHLERLPDTDRSRTLQTLAAAITPLAGLVGRKPVDEIL